MGGFFCLGHYSYTSYVEKVPTLMLLKWFPCKLYLTTNLICSASGFSWGTISLSRLTPWVLPHLLGHMGPYWVEMIPRYMGPRVAQGVGLLFSVHTLFLNYFLIECVFWRSHSIKTFCWMSSYFWLFFFPFFSFVFLATIFYEVCEVMICWFCWCLVILSSTWSWWCLRSWDF